MFYLLSISEPWMRVDWERQGIVGSDGHLGRSVRAAWVVPEDVSVDGGRLLYGPAHGALGPSLTSGRRVIAKPRMLDEFVRLPRAKNHDTAVLRFARRWGALEICSAHAKPRSHLPLRFQRLLDDPPLCRPAGGPPYGNWGEDVSRWLHYARQAQSILDLAARLMPADATAVAPTDWPVEALGDLFWPELERHFDGGRKEGDGSVFAEVGGGIGREVPVQRRLVAEAVQGWLDLGDAHVTYRWEDDSAEVDLGSNSLFGGLALQLALAVARIESLQFCAECGDGFAPRRLEGGRVPQRCPPCRQRAAKRQWARKNRRGGPDGK